jgi:ArsR family transcriptional regulator, arsenate/arsenite/antimonite-responsive transcriptional repressor
MHQPESRQVVILGALAQLTRLRVVGLVARAGPKGIAAGEIARALRCPASTLSFHLKDLSSAGLIEARTRGRFVIYSVQTGVLEDLSKFIAGLGGVEVPAVRKARSARTRQPAQHDRGVDRSQLSIFGD